MKKSKWIVAAMSVAAMGGQVVADDSWQWSEGSFQPNDSYYEFDEGCCENKWLVAAEFLWWTSGDYYPFANNLFSNTGLPLANATTPFSSETDTVIEPYVRISEKWSPGVRVGLGWESCEGDWQIWGVWTGYSNYGRRVINSIPPSPTSSPSARFNFGELTPPIGSEISELSIAFLGGRPAGGVIGTTVTATHKLNYNVADLVLGQKILNCYGVELMPYFGVRALFVNQRDYARFTGLAQTAGLFTVDLSGTTRIEEEMWSVGPRLGLQASWGDWCGFTLLGNISGAILYGRVEESVQITRNFPLTVAFEPVITDIVSFNTYTQDRYNVIVPNLQVQLGIGYKFDFDLGCSPCCLDVYALWEGNAYWNASNVLLQERKLGLNGLTTGFAFAW